MRAGRANIGRYIKTISKLLIINYIHSISLFSTVTFLSILNFIINFLILLQVWELWPNLPYLLYYFLIIKNNIYKSIFYYFDFVENEKNTKLIIFLTGFVFSSWFFNVFFFIINNYYDLKIIMFFFLLFLNLFNLIEKKLIFNEKNLLKINQEMDYDHVRSFLKININVFCVLSCLRNYRLVPALGHTNPKLRFELAPFSPSCASHLNYLCLWDLTNVNFFFIDKINNI